MFGDQSVLKTTFGVVFFLLIVVGIYTDFLRVIPRAMDKFSKLNSATAVLSSHANNVVEGGGDEYISFSGLYNAATVPAVLAPPASSLPVRNWAVPIPELTAKNVYVLDGQNNVVLLAKHENEKNPIASLSKLMTAYVAVKYIPLASNIKIDQKALAEEGTAGDFIENEELKLIDVLYALLLPSSNDAAAALAEVLGEEKFVSLMNEEARIMGVSETSFKNATGLDATGSYSTARDIVKIFSYVFETDPIKNIIAKNVYETRSTDGKYYHRFLSSNWLLGSYPGVIGGKTGFTDEAGQALIVSWNPPEHIAIERKDSLPVIYAVVLGSQDRFADMRTLLDWLQEAYHW